MRVQLFIPCFVDQLFAATATSMVKVLKRVGCDISYNSKQTCCGQPAYNAGFWEESRTVAEKFLREFNDDDYIVAPGGSCTGFIRNHYHKLFSGMEMPGAHIIPRFYEFSEFLSDVLQVSDIGASFKGVATYHDACGALRECGIKSAPRRLLSNVKGLELRETDDCEVCCGFGGSFSVKFEAISTGMAEQKTMNALATRADYIISTDSSCLMQLDGYIRQHNFPIKTIHLADVLASGW